jgi:hypothetical protein
MRLLILGADLGSNSQDGSDARGGGGTRRSWSFRGGAAWGSSVFGILVVPKLKTTRVWVGRDQRDMRDSPRAQAGYGEALGDARKDDGGTARRGSSA